MSEEAGVGAVRGSTAVATNSCGTYAAGEHALDGEFGPWGETVVMLFEERVPALVVLGEQFGGAGNINVAEYNAEYWS